MSPFHNVVLASSRRLNVTLPDNWQNEIAPPATVICGENAFSAEQKLADEIYARIAIDRIEEYFKGLMT
ncbi:hypothetical protein HNQ99_002685 [Rhizorhapis suberifaciens]|uniref:Uncharacterized protein n=1 Tax=Rhizorhapis suberifaciens TaxID=13656 RepID=A0A840HXS6_9SPHN|nr:hypothetical protein [Rhizorhapis suberifaciens]